MDLSGMRHMMVFLFLAASACLREGEKAINPVAERYRPSIHFTPKKNWINDPNGLVYFDGEFHMFYQYNPHGDVWGHMSWGHAVSPDLLKWTELPVAIPEYVDQAGDSVMAFSGTVVVDRGNTSGLCTSDSCLLAVFTSDVHSKGQDLRQHQSVAFSNDRGRNWSLYERNPVVDIGRKEFRDPKVFWHDATAQWVMIVALPDEHKIQFYRSGNLLKWNLMSEFGPLGDTSRIWECPDLYEVPVDGEAGVSHWVLSLSGGHPQGPDFVGMQYFVGHFDGQEFKVDNPGRYPLYLDYGKDFYAGIVYNNFTSQGKPVMIGWVNNWTYAGTLPTSPWRGSMSLPRELSLMRSEGGLALRQQLPPSFARLRQDSIQNVIEHQGGDPIELEVTIKSNELAGIRLFKTPRQEVVIAFDPESNTLLLDRTQSGNTLFNSRFPSLEKVTLSGETDVVELRIVVDNGIIEVFGNDGSVVLTEIVFPLEPSGRIEAFAPGPGSEITLRGWTLKRIR